MKIKLLCAYMTAILIVISCGCKKDAKDTNSNLKISQKSKKISEMSSGDTIVKVGNVSLTHKKYNKILEKNELDFRFRNPNVDEGMVKAYVSGREKTIIREFITRQLFLKAANDSNITVPDEIIQRRMNDFEMFLKRKKTTKAKFFGLTGRTEDELIESHKERALIEEYLKSELGNKLVVTPEDIEEEKKDYERYNKLCASTNKAIMAHGELIVSKIKAGADFNLTALEYSQDEENDVGVWGEFTRLEIEDEKIREDAFALPIGTVSGPYDTEEGMIIIKINDRRGVDSPVGVNSAVVNLGRIFIKMWRNFECPDDKELVKMIEKDKKKRFIVPLVEKLKKTTTIEFPNGTNLWDNAQEISLQ